LKQDTSFKTLQEAEDYVIEKNKKHSNMLTYVPHHWLMTKSLENIELLMQFYRDFCFDNDEKYLHHRRYFLGEPNVKQFLKQLRQESIQVV
jgi:hypothetical protein